MWESYSWLPHLGDLGSALKWSQIIGPLLAGSLVVRLVGRRCGNPQRQRLPRWASLVVADDDGAADDVHQRRGLRVVGCRRPADDGAQEPAGTVDAEEAHRVVLRT